MSRSENLRVFQEADRLAVGVYDITERHFSAQGRYGLSSQLKRAAVSVAANIVQGCQMNSDKDFVHFLTMAASSAAKVSYLVGFSVRVHLVSLEDTEELERQYTGLVRQIHKLAETVREGGMIL